MHSKDVGGLAQWVVWCTWSMHSKDVGGLAQWVVWCTWSMHSEDLGGKAQCVVYMVYAFLRPRCNSCTKVVAHQPYAGA